MAYDNINERRKFVKEQLESKVSERTIRKKCAVMFNCHISAINSDIQFIRHAETEKEEITTCSTI